MTSVGREISTRANSDRGIALAGITQFCEYAQAGPTKDGSKDSYRGDRRRRIRRMDRALSAAPWCARDSGGRVGPGQLARLVGRRDSRHSRDLWTEPALHEDGGPGHAV